MGKRSVWHTRGTLPDELRDTNAWPEVDLMALEPPQREIAERRWRAICAYLQGHAVGLIARECGIHRSELLRHFNRCLDLHADGRIYGWRAVLPYEHVKSYVRLAAPEAHSRGQAGVFRQFLTNRPDIREALDDAILNNTPEQSKESPALERWHGMGRAGNSRSADFL